MAQDPKFDQLKQKYQSVINEAQSQGVRLSHVNMEGNKLFIQGEAPSEQAKNKVWDQIKLIDPSYSDLTADITVAAGASSQSASSASSSGSATQTAGASVGGGQSTRTYTVQPGDNLSKISQHFYGSANQYNKIFEANRDQLSNPDQIRVGQTLKIPA